MPAASMLTFATLAGLCITPAFGLNASHTALGQLALAKVLQDAVPIFGIYEKNESSTARWQKAYSDDTLIVHMNLPGAHDADTWNYSTTTQAALTGIQQLAGNPDYPPSFFRCQDQSISHMLNAGLRVFDLRYAHDVTNTSLVFWHGPGLMSQTATLDDVLFGFYHWLDHHPSEAIFISLQYEVSTERYAHNDASVQMQLYSALTSPAARQYFVQAQGSFGTLGEARGKATLLRRFELDQLPQAYTDALSGVLFSPAAWSDDGRNITLVYNATTGATAYIEDQYQPATPIGTSAEISIQSKFNVTMQHLTEAATTNPDSLFWSFASSTNLLSGIPPEVQALGNGTNTTAGGVNDRLVPYFKTMQGKRLGIVMFDFFEQPADLIPTFLSLLPPNETGQQRC